MKAYEILEFYKSICSLYYEASCRIKKPLRYNGLSPGWDLWWENLQIEMNESRLIEEEILEVSDAF